MPVLPLDATCPLKTPHIPSSYSNEQTTKETKAINNSHIYIYISHVNVTQTVPDISPLMPMHQDPLLVVSHLVRPFVNLSETIAGYRSNRSPLLIMLTGPFCRNSSINISIDNRYDNRFIHLGRPIFTANHNGACVYNRDYTSIIVFTSSPTCLLVQTRFNDHERRFFFSASAPNNPPFLPVGALWWPVITQWL